MKKLNNYMENIKNSFGNISSERKELLEDFAQYIEKELKKGDDVNLIFICTHNSRRSHMAQIWAAAAAEYYGMENISCYSGGTEATAFNPRAVNALRKAGFDITIVKEGDNPVYKVQYSDDNHLNSFSKVYDDDHNPDNFAAVMTCSDADANCPYIPGAKERFSITYDDPKEFDGTEFEEEKYDERCKQIAIEMFYIFHKIDG